MTSFSNGLASLIERQAVQGADRVALQFEGQAIRYGALWQSILAAQARLAAAGVKPGDRVAYLGLNQSAMLVLLFALARQGAILLPLNYRLAEPELAEILSHAGATLVLCDASHQIVGSRLGTSGSAKLMMASDIAGSISTETVATQQLESGGVEATPSAGNAASPVLLVYTSGTTGKPKGALHTQAGLLANCAISCAVHGFTAADHVLTVLPLFHVGGLCIQTLPALQAGAQVTLHARFDAGAWLDDVAHLRPTTQ